MLKPSIYEKMKNNIKNCIYRDQVKVYLMGKKLSAQLVCFKLLDTLLMAYAHPTIIYELHEKVLSAKIDGKY